MFNSNSSPKVASRNVNSVWTGTGLTDDGCAISINQKTISYPIMWHDRVLCTVHVCGVTGEKPKTFPRPVRTETNYTFREFRFSAISTNSIVFDTRKISNLHFYIFTVKTQTADARKGILVYKTISSETISTVNRRPFRNENKPKPCVLLTSLCAPDPNRGLCFGHFYLWVVM